MTTKTTNAIRAAASTKLGVTLASALMLAAVGCGADGTIADPSVTEPTTGGEATAFAPPTMSAESEALLRLRAEVAFPDRGFVKFFEPEDGVLLIQEAGRNNTAPMIPSAMGKLDATQMYEALSGKAAPTELVQATARAAALTARTAVAGVAKVADLSPSLSQTATRELEAKGDVQKISSAITFANGYDQWFYDNFCAGGYNVDRGNTGTWDFLINWMFVTGSGSFTRNDQNWVDSTVSVYGGGAVHYRVRIQPWYSWSTVADVQIQNGYYNKYHRSNGTDYDVNASVDQADGDSYHWCAYGDSW
jgi:hypothetical protein